MRFISLKKMIKTGNISLNTFVINAYLESLDCPFGNNIHIAILNCPYLSRTSLGKHQKRSGIISLFPRSIMRHFLPKFIGSNIWSLSLKVVINTG